MRYLLLCTLIACSSASGSKLDAKPTPAERNLVCERVAILGVTGLVTATGGVTTPANLTTTGTGTGTSVILNGTTQGGITTVSSAVAAASAPNSGFARLEVRMTGATSAAAYIDGTLRATITTNIPTGSTRQADAGVLISKHAGTTSRVMWLDQTTLSADLTAAR